MSQNTNQQDLIGQSQVFLDALDHASTIAKIERPILVIGERGTGKELFASRIHFLSPRWEGPLVKINCAAMAENLLESELFGHEAGAFTGATKRHIGRFERAEGGTLFLDEIASASLRVQEKLLRVIEYGEYERVGGEKTLSTNVRIVAAANVDLRKRVADGDFRADLLDRLAFDVVSAPPLRHRTEDIVLLAAHFAQMLAHELNDTFPGFSPDALATLNAHDWPGNVRELKNVSERAFYQWLNNSDTHQIETIIIDPFTKAFGALPSALPSPKTPGITESAVEKSQTSIHTYHEDRRDLDLREHLDEIEKQIVITTLRQTAGNQKRAADRLHLSYDQIRGIVRKHELNPSDYN